MRAWLGIPLALLAGACLVQRPTRDRPEPAGVHETRRTAHPGGATRRELTLLVWPDGHSERDGPEREFHPDGSPAAERVFVHGVPTGLWRTWYPDGTLRSEVDFGSPDSSALLVNRFWHANARLAAEGKARAGVREGPWSFWSEVGSLQSEGGYRAGRRDGPWILYDAAGRKQAQGQYALGERVGPWILWDVNGEPHTSPPAPERDADQ